MNTLVEEVTNGINQAGIPFQVRETAKTCRIVQVINASCLVCHETKNLKICTPLCGFHLCASNEACHKKAEEHKQICDEMNDLLSTCCLNCLSTNKPLLKCNACSSVKYCSRQCQKIDWQFHKLDCKRSIKK
jgi:hypothetical protein